MVVFLLTLLIIVGGSYCYYSLLNSPNTSKETFWYQFFVDESEPVIVIPDYFENLPHEAAKFRKLSDEEFPFEGLGVDVSKSNLSQSSTNNRDAGSSYLDNVYSYNGKVQGDRIYNGLLGGLANSSGAKGGSGLSNNTNSGSFGGSAIGSPLAVPFSPNQPVAPSTKEGTILFDPSVVTINEVEDNAIPVREGWWILLIMGMSYGLFRKTKEQRLKKNECLRRTNAR